ncbi:MAG: hypothetical protein AAGG02_07395 [Cyanobacteria bacterium P01_H01_bin.15]
MSLCSREQIAKLEALIIAAGYQGWTDFSQQAQISDWQIMRVRYGLLPQLSLETTLKLSQALNLSVEQFLQALALVPETSSQPNTSRQPTPTKANFVQESLSIVEPWLRQWPSVMRALEQNPELPGVRLVPLLKPLFQLLDHWDVQEIGPLGQDVTFSPQWHQPVQGVIAPETPVKITRVGYRQGERLLFRAEVSEVK